MRWASCVAYMREVRNVHNILARKLKGTGGLGDTGAYVKMILEWILKKWCVCVGWSRFDQERAQWRGRVNTDSMK